MDNEGIINMAIEYGVLSRKSLSKRISQAYVDVQHSIENDKLQTLSVLSESTQSQQDIPVDLFDQMLSI